MFTMSMIEMVAIVSSAIATSVVFTLCSSILNDLEKSFTNLKIERNTLKVKVETLMSNLDEMESQKNNVQNNVQNKVYSVNAADINNILVVENRKLNIRCDMLEEELKKTREKQVVLNSKKHV